MSAVVGPNGSGKSNLADAVRWVLGEASARALRGQRMEDVIFNGTSRRRALPLAEVSLVLDNAGGTLPLPFAEVSVTRRVDRGGTSDYLINRSACRLRDVQDLFAGTGLGRHAYAIVGQGEVDEVLRARPPERRSLVEEAAGITRYRQRLQDAGRRRAVAASHLARLGDLLAERQRSLTSLGRQAERAKRHAQLSEALRQVETRLWARQWSTATAERATARAAADQALARQDAATEALAAAAAAQRQHAADQAAARAREASAAEASANAERSLDRARQAVALAGGLRQAATSEAGRAQVRAAELTARRAEEEQALAAAVAAAQAAAEARVASEGVAAAAVTELERVAGARRQGVALGQATQRELSTLRQERAAAGAAAATRAGALRAIAEGVERLRVARIRLAEADAALQAAGAAVAPAEAAEAAARGGQAELRAHRDRLAAAAGALRGRVRVLAEVAASGAGYAQGPRSVLAGKAKGDPAFAGVVGAIGELLEVPPHLGRAIAAALGGAVQDLVTTTADAAEAAIAGLKRLQGGRATFLPLDALRSSGPSQDLLPLAQQPGAVGWAADLVGCAPEVRPAVVHVLGRVLVATDLAAARQLARRSGLRVRVVTLDGDVVQPGGAMTGGAVRGERTDGLLGRDQERRRQQVRLDALTADLQRVEAALGRQGTDLEGVQRVLAQRRGEFAAAQARSKVASAECAQLEREHAERQRVLEDEDRRAPRLALTPEELAARERVLETQLATVTAESGRLEAEEGLQREAATAARVALAEQVARQRAADEDVARRQAALADVVARLDELERDRRRAADAAQDQEHAEQVARAQVEQASRDLAAAKERLEAMRGELTSLHDRVAAASVARETAEQAREQAAADARRAEAAAARQEAALAALAARLETAYGWLPEALAAVVPSSDPPSDQRKAAELREEVAGIGGVRPEAIPEYEAEVTAVARLDAGVEDLVGADAALGQWVQAVDAALADRYVEALAAVRLHFSAIYTRLCGGGTADLVPVGGSDPQGSVAQAPGLEIVAQPPGKQLAHLGLLSGGERTLVAIALVLAFLQVRPAAFCILDEVEAALDESNVARCAAYLQEMASGTQFIVVTHQKGTMEAADRLIGVTMEEPGVSRLLTVRLAG